jgi:hypothetical protein
MQNEFRGNREINRIPVARGNHEEPAMMVVCSVSALIRTALFIVTLALVAGLALAGPAAPASTPGSGPVVATTEPVTH